LQTDHHVMQETNNNCNEHCVVPRVASTYHISRDSARLLTTLAYTESNLRTTCILF